MAGRRKKSNKKSFIILSALLLTGIAALIGYQFYRYFFLPAPGASAGTVIFIPSGSDYQKMVTILKYHHLIKDEESFHLLARKMNLINHIHPGRYIIKSNSSLYEIIRKLRSGESDPVRVAIDQVSTIEELCSKVGKSLEIDSAQLMDTLTSHSFLKANRIKYEEIMTLFIPDTYEFYWEISLSGFLNKMKKVYDKFWNHSNLKKAKNLQLTPAEIYTLASIVQEEAVIADEMPRIAGVYLNRIKKGMALQADPTIKFIIRNRKDNKLNLSDYQIESPYNTYLHKGLPPGPIYITSTKALLAVLNAEKHNYIYFCARADRSGYHEFTDNYQKHLYYRNLYLKSKQN